MSKAVFTMEMPKNCYECPFSCTNGNDTDCGYCELEMYFVDGEVVINEEYFDFESEVKPDWCPLKLLPEKMTGVAQTDHWNSIIAGWNGCINEITGEVK